MPKVVDAATAFRELPVVFIEPPNEQIDPMRDRGHGSSSMPSSTDGDNLRHNGRACVSDCGMSYGNRGTATPPRNSLGLRADGLAPRVVYVYQREHGTVLPNLVEPHDATCHISSLLDIFTVTCGMMWVSMPVFDFRTSVGHLDHEDCVANGISAMVASLGPASVAYELHIIGAFDDSHSCIEDDKEVILVDEDVDGDGDGDDSDSSDDDDEWPLDDAMPMNRTSSVVLEEVDEVDEERVTGMGATSDAFSRSAWESGSSSHVRNITSEAGVVSTLASCSAIEDDGCVSRNEQGEAGATSAEDRKGKRILDWEYDSGRHRQMDRMEGHKEHGATAAVVKVSGGGNDGAGDGFPGHSWPLATVLINCLHRSSVVFELRTACILHLNTSVGANGASFPIVRGFGVVPTTGRIFPAQFAPEARCPDVIVRGVFVTLGSDNYQAKGTLIGPYDTNTDSFRIGPYQYVSVSRPPNQHDPSDCTGCLF
ncbi:hypothetical protein CBR_g34612 [Chara braunii]|uniref:Uncharacterized protein n=1 Tax=Chara braunii TaxID=69332 RepID=A0A388LJ33_CHABU|nr:hypothetical protein CBR_g34612 [Chara braunii]|eukprot:GBG82329.1 hypothetical protein CBR_g34612 [Chara braunii]